MRYAIFEVRKELLVDFVSHLVHLSFEGIISGKDEDKVFNVKIPYERDEEEDISEMEEMLEELERDSEDDANDEEDENER